MTGTQSRPRAGAIALGAIVLAAIITLVVVVALGIGPFAPAPAQTNVPSAEPTIPQTQTPVAPSVLPSTTAQPSSTSSQSPASPRTATDVLLSHIPADVRSGCAVQPVGQPALATVSCSAEDGALDVTYTLYADQLSMGAVYEASVIGAGIEDNSGRCYNKDDAGQLVATKSRWPSENGYTVNDESAGRYLCFDNSGTPTITWTDDRSSILGVATSAAENVDRLVNFWVDEAGPTP